MSGYWVSIIFVLPAGTIMGVRKPNILVPYTRGYRTFPDLANLLGLSQSIARLYQQPLRDVAFIDWLMGLQNSICVIDILLELKHFCRRAW